MASGLHGENGLDPETSLHLIQIYVLPVLLYGLDVVLPTAKQIKQLDTFYRKFLKQILSLPQTVANPAVYILSGTIPIEAYIHKRSLTLFGNICRLENSVENSIVKRQLSVKSIYSCSWSSQIRQILLKYELPEPLDLLDNPVEKAKWKSQVNKAVNNYWTDKIKHSSTLYPSLKYLNVDRYRHGATHQLVTTIKNAAEIPRINTKMKIATGTYILQVNRASFNQNTTNPECMLCKSSDETLQHFLLECTALTNTRIPILRDITSIYSAVPNDECSMLQLVVDPSVLASNISKPIPTYIKELEYHSRRLCFSLHVERYKKLSLVPSRKRNKR